MQRKIPIPFHEDRHEQLRHIGHSQPPGEQENILHSLQRSSPAIFHDALVQQSLADITAKKRNPPDSQRTDEENALQQRIFPAKAPDIVQVQGMGIHVHHPGGHKQHQLYQGVVHHVQKRSMGCQYTVFRLPFYPGHAQHPDSHQDETNLGHRGTGQRPLQIHREHCQQSAPQHGDHPQRQYQPAPFPVPGKQAAAQNQDTVNTRFGQNAGQQRGSRGRGHRMGLWQPDVQRESPRLGPEAEEHAGAGRIQQIPLPAVCSGGGQFADRQRPQLMVQQENAHEHHKPSCHRHGQVGVRRPQRRPVLLLGHPHIGGEGHYLKKDKCGVQIRGQEHSQGSPQSPQQKQVKTAAMVQMGKIFPGENRRHHPHERRHTAVNRPKSVQHEPQSQAADIRNLQDMGRLTADGKI